MTTNPVLSFIVPTRNAEEILEFTLSNLLDSVDQRYEVVLNLNNSEGYVQEYITKFNDNRLKIYYAPPKVIRTGISPNKAMNTETINKKPIRKSYGLY